MVNQCDVPEFATTGWVRKNTESLCPECLSVIPAELVNRDGQIFMEKSCPEHGATCELISSDAEFFMLLEHRASLSPARTCGADAADQPLEPTTARTSQCPFDCGICGRHVTSAMMINIDLTNRCNLRCPICFANADATGYVAEVTREQAREMMQRSFRQGKPDPTCVQFAGGEPTVHPDFVDICRDASKLGYSQVQVASNGIRFGREPDFCRACADAGLNVVYLQFDGLSDDVYRKSRGRSLVDIKLQAVENVYKAGMRTCLVPTVIKGVTDDQIGPTIKYAVRHARHILGISWQPIAFTGRVEEEDRQRQRFTLADLARCIQEQTGLMDMYRDWYPFAFVEPFSDLVEALTGETTIRTTCHSHCGMATYLAINTVTGEAAPLPKFVDVEGLIEEIGRIAEQIRRGGWKANRWYLAMAFRRLRKHYRPQQSITGWDFSALSDFLASYVEFGKRYPDNDSRVGEVEHRDTQSMLLSAMHFQDLYNFELARVQQCLVHYSAPDGRMYPFCTYNAGPTFRQNVESAIAKRKSHYEPGAPCDGPQS